MRPWDRVDTLPFSGHAVVKVPSEQPHRVLPIEELVAFMANETSCARADGLFHCSPGHAWRVRIAVYARKPTSGCSPENVGRFLSLRGGPLVSQHGWIKYDPISSHILYMKEVL